MVALHTLIVYITIGCLFTFRYILSGFELELFSAHEYPYLYWYLYELLFPWLTTCLHKADSHLIEYEHYAENQTKSQGKIIFNN